MMYSYRITKYNPTFRDERGYYTIDEWTSISDIGKNLNDGILSLDEYMRVESLYIDAIFEFIKCLSIAYLEVEMLTRWNNILVADSGHYTNDMRKLYETVEEGDVLEAKEIDILSRLVLRDELGCKMRYKDDLYIHFGYDYYMYVVCSSECLSTVKKIQNSGLFVEPYKSPYLEDQIDYFEPHASLITPCGFFVKKIFPEAVDVSIRHFEGVLNIIGLEYIVKLYNGTYKELAEKLEITPSTVTDQLSKRRPIPNSKLEALSRLFKLEVEYFQKELTKIEEIELQLEYLNRVSKKDSFEIPDYFTDADAV